MRIDKAQVEHAYRELQLSEMEAYFQEIEQRIQEVASTDSFQGRAARAMKSYLKEVHGMAVKSFIIVLMEIESGMNRFLNNFSQVDESDQVILDGGYLEHIRDVITNFRQDMHHEFGEFSQQMNIASHAMNISSGGINNAMNNLDHDLDQALRISVETNETMRAFDYQHMAEVESLNNHLATLEQVLSKINVIIIGGIDDFVPGSFANSALGQQLFNHMLNSALAMAQHGSMNSAVEALSILGGYISTLPFKTRRLFETMKGRAVWCAMVGDPVNAATGNFIYDHVDMKIDGRYPLEFKRFYNSLDATTSTLGRNWTHCYDVRIRELADGGITIIYGDSRQDHFDKPKNEGSNTLVSSPSNFNILTRLEGENGYKLGFADGGRYLFNKEGQLTHQIDHTGNEIKLSYEADQLIKIESPSGYLKLIYDGDYIKRITDHTGRAISFEFENDLLNTYINVLGYSYSHEYDLRKRLVKITNPAGNLIVGNEYDEKDRIIKQTYADGSKMEYRYNAVAKRKNTTDFTKQNGSKITYKRDSHYRTTGIIEPDGEIKIEYNEKSQRSSYTDKLGYLTSFWYNKAGNIAKITNPLGVTTELEYVEDSSKITSITIDGNQKFRNSYDDAGKLVSIKDALNSVTTISYTQNDLPELITQADGSQIHLRYDERGNIIQVKDASGITTEYFYDTLNRVIGTIDGNKNETNFGYDEQGNISAVTNANGYSQTYDYNKINKVSKITDFNNAETKREYNELGKLSKVIDPLGRETSLDYDVMWNLSQVKQANGAETKFLYNKMNRLETVVKPDSSKFLYRYDANGNRTKIINEEGNETNLSYDAIGQLIEVSGEEGLKFSYTYSSEGQLTNVKDSMNNIVNLEYDRLGQLIKESNTLGDSRVYTYTTLGKISSTTDEAGRVTKYEYELGGRLKSISHPDGTNEVLSYDSNGNIKTHTNKTGQTVEYIYDSLNRVVAVEGNGGTKAYTYDPAGNVVSMTDELSNKTSYEHSLTGQLTKVTDALGNATSYVYDELDQLIEVCQEGTEVLGHDDALDNANRINEENQGSRITKYHRNIMGQIESVEDAHGNKEFYKYSPKGQLIEKLDKDSYLIKYGYTKLGDVSHIQYADDREVVMSYNALRQLTEIQDWLGTTSIEIDALGRVTKVKDHNDNVVSYEYGKLGERQSITYPDGRKVGHHYDDALRLIKINDDQQEIKYHYGKFSRLISKQFVNDVRTEYSYNQLGQLEALRHFGAEGLLDKYIYRYDQLGNKTSIEKQRQGLEADSGLFCYSYDRLNRLSEVTKDGNQVRSYSYDNFSNRSEMVEKGTKTNYHFNALNQLISSTDGMSYSYDGRGNMIEIYQDNQLINKHHFGALNRLESTYNIEQNLGASYQYNGLGHRVGRTEGQSLEPVLPTTKLDDMTLNPTKQVNDALDLTRQYHNLLERKENGRRISYTYDFGVISAGSEGENLNYLSDDLGSPVRLMHETGAELDVLGFDEFGNSMTNHAPKTSNPFGFTSYQFDLLGSSGLSPSRAYDPKIGRFTSEDSHWKPYNQIYGNFGRFVPSEWAIRQSRNLYDYAIGNPLKFIDLIGTDIILPEDPEQQQRILRELNTLVGTATQEIVVNDIFCKAISPTSVIVQVDPILGSRINENGDIVVEFIRPPNPNFPQSTDLVDRLINGDHSVIIEFGASHNVRADDWDAAGELGIGSGSLIRFSPNQSPRLPIINENGSVRGVRHTTTQYGWLFLGHELIHADRMARGVHRPLGEFYTHHFTRRRHFLWMSFLGFDQDWFLLTPTEELATIGLLDQRFNDDCELIDDITENDLREEHGLPRRGSWGF